jgi:putative ABC transport system substrate-binding protein
MNTRRKVITALGTSALFQPFASWSQQSGKVWRIGYLDVGSRKSLVETGRAAALIEGLRERGYVAGKNFVLEERYADGNASLLYGQAAELVNKQVDLIVTLGTPASHAAQKATSNVPIVVAATADPVVDGFAESLARPGRNITGMSSGIEDTLEKLLEYLLVVSPKAARVAVLSSPANSTHAKMLTRIQIAARNARKTVIALSAGNPQDIERAFLKAAQERADALIVLADTFFTQQRQQIVDLALKQRLASVSPFSFFPGSGGLMSYGADVADNFRRAGVFIDKIFKGANLAEIPNEQPTRYYLVVNRKTANALGLKLSNEILARADKVIE